MFITIFPSALLASIGRDTVRRRNIRAYTRAANALLAKFQLVDADKRTNDWNALVNEAHEALPSLSPSETVEVLYRIHKSKYFTTDENIVFSFLCHIFRKDPVRQLNATTTHRQILQSSKMGSNTLVIESLQSQQLLRVMLNHRKLVRSQWRKWLTDGLANGIMKQKPEYISLIIGDIALMPHYASTHIFEAAAASLKRNRHLLCYRTAVFLLSSFGRVEYHDTELATVLWEYLKETLLQEGTSLDLLALALRGLMHASIQPPVAFLVSLVEMFENSLQAIPVKYLSWISEALAYFGMFDKSAFFINQLLCRTGTASNSLLSALEINDLSSCLLIFENKLMEATPLPTSYRQMLTTTHCALAHTISEFCYSRIFEIQPPFRVFLLDMLCRSFLFNPMPPKHLFRPSIGSGARRNPSSSYARIAPLLPLFPKDAPHTATTPTTPLPPLHKLIRCFLYSIYFRVAALNGRCLVILLDALLHIQFNEREAILHTQANLLPEQCQLCDRSLTRIILRELNRKLDELSPEAVICCVSQLAEGNALLLYPQFTVRILSKFHGLSNARGLNKSTVSKILQILRAQKESLGPLFPYKTALELTEFYPY